MPQIINTNIASLTAQRNLNNAQSDNAQALNRLSSGLRINSAKDDAAGMAISTRFDSQIKGLDVATRNAGDGVSLAQTAEGGLASMTTSLQRLRELAVQSSNATNSSVDRSALNEEAQQLIAEIGRVSEETNFNGVKLLNGDFKDATFQVGANVGETIDVSVGKVTVDTLGIGASGGVTAVGGKVGTDTAAGALKSGDLNINGTAVLASKGSDDTLSFQSKANSAISKVAAINAVSDESGVRAEVVDTTVSGSEQTAAAVSGTFTLNGVDISLNTTADAATTRSSVVDAINAKTGLTGVTAINSGDDKAGVQLVADDGRNITTSLGTNLTAANTGLSADGTYTGSYTLANESGSGAITVSGGDGTISGDLARAGLAAGEYKTGEAATSSTVIKDASGPTINFAALAVGISGANAVETASGTAVAAETAETISVFAGSQTPAAVAVDEASDFATLLNSLDGVTATARTGAVLTGVDTTLAGNLDATINGQAIAATDIDTFITAINANTTLQAAGITAAKDGDSALTILAADGRDIIITDYLTAGVTDTVSVAALQGDGTVAGATTLTVAGNDSTRVHGYVDVKVTDPDITNIAFSSATATTLIGSQNTVVDSAVTQPGVPLRDGDMAVNGTQIGASLAKDDTASSTLALSSNAAGSGIAVAAAINRASDSTGVTAKVNETVVVGGTSAQVAAGTAGDSGEIFINGVSLGSVTLAGDADADRNTAIDLINAKQGETGVSANDNGTSITLTAADGRNISVGIDGGANADFGKNIGLAKAVDGIGEGRITDTRGEIGGALVGYAGVAETTYSSVSLSSASTFTVSAGTNGDKGVTDSGFKQGEFGGAANGQFLKDVDISTVKGANSALAAVDNALQQVNTERAKLGAIQNRFEATITSNTLNSENLSAANSRIRDADFAAETASLSRSQVLQQAGISILAQANALPQQALSLLG